MEVSVPVATVGNAAPSMRMETKRRRRHPIRGYQSAICRAYRTVVRNKQVTANLKTGPRKRCRNLATVNNIRNWMKTYGSAIGNDDICREYVIGMGSKRPEPRKNLLSFTRIDYAALISDTAGLITASTTITSIAEKSVP